jgi:hypothetical protein
MITDSGTAPMGRLSFHNTQSPYVCLIVLEVLSIALNISVYHSEALPNRFFPVWRLKEWKLLLGFFVSDLSTGTITSNTETVLSLSLI